MRVARTIKGLTHRNTLGLRKVKVYFQRFPGKAGTDAERGIADAEYTLRVDGKVAAKGKTAADGSMELLLPAGVPAELEIFGTKYDVKIANRLEALTDIAGQQRRLAMLGYDIGAVDGTWGGRSDRAAMDFQGDQGLEPDGVVGAGTRNKLKTVFGE